MQNNSKDKILDQLKTIDESVAILNTQKEMLSIEIKKINYEEKRERLKKAISKNKIDWPTVLSIDENNEPLPGALDFVSEYLKDYFFNVKIKGHYPQSMQMGVHFFLSKKTDSDSFILKLAPILRSLIPISWNEQYPASIAIPIIDKKNGTTGSYSLLINEQRLGRIVKVSGNKVDFKTNYTSLKQCIEWAKKNCFYYE